MRKCSCGWGSDYQGQAPCEQAWSGDPAARVIPPDCLRNAPRGGMSIPWRRSTDPRSPTFEPTVLFEMNGKNYYVHLDVYAELKRLEDRVDALKERVRDAEDGR